MGLESGTYVNDLVATNPVGATDYKQYGDDHLRLIKTVLKNTFPGMGGAMSRVSTKTGNYTILSTDNTVLFNCTTALTLSITAAATLSNGFVFAVYANGADVVVDPNGSELINGATTITVPNGNIALVWCSGVAFYAALTGPVMTTALQLRHASVASGATVDLGAVGGNTVTVTHTSGTTAITSLGGASLKRGTQMTLVFSITGGTLSLTHHATNLILAGGANITLANGDVITFVKNHDSNAEWKMTGGVKADGTAWSVSNDGRILQYAAATPYTAYSSDSSGSLPIDDTIPQNTEGSAYCSLAFTPVSSTSKLRIVGRAVVYGNGANTLVATICDTSISNALAVSATTVGGLNYACHHNVETVIDSPGAARTYQLRLGANSGVTFFVNGNSSGRLFGGSTKCTLEIYEFEP